MRTSTLILLVFLLLIISCKKSKNEQYFVGVYSGEWYTEETHYEFIDSTAEMIPYTLRDTFSGQFQVTREEKDAVMNGHFSKIKLKELEYNKTFKYNSPTAGPFGSANYYSYWNVVFFEDGHMEWEEGNTSSGQYSSTYITQFVGTKQD